MPDLPVPRDAAEREKMVAAWRDGARRVWGNRPLAWRGADAEAEAAIPPVGEEKMPELRRPWRLLSEDGGTSILTFATADEAEANRFQFDAPENWRVVRLAVVEVAPAPDSWEKLARDAIACRDRSDVSTAELARRAALLAGKGES